MSFRAHDERALARIETSLRRSDPRLAEQFQRFNEWSRQGATHTEQWIRRKQRAKGATARHSLPGREEK